MQVVVQTPGTARVAGNPVRRLYTLPIRQFAYHFMERHLIDGRVFVRPFHLSFLLLPAVTPVLDYKRRGSRCSGHWESHVNHKHYNDTNPDSIISANVHYFPVPRSTGYIVWWIRSRGEKRYGARLSVTGRACLPKQPRRSVSIETDCSSCEKEIMVRTRKESE